MSPEWERFYADGSSFSIGTYPYLEKLVGMFVKEAPRMLELGSGLGCEIPYFSMYMKFGYHGVDGSTSAVMRLQNIYGWLAGRLKLADFTKEIPFDGPFDFVVDRASIPHNELVDIRSCLKLVYEKLSPGGILICSDWFSDAHSEVGRGQEISQGTRGGYPDGQFRQAGKVHFSSEDELADLFKDFEFLYLEERITRRVGPGKALEQVIGFPWISAEYRKQDYRSSVWDIVVRKPV